MEESKIELYEDKLLEKAPLMEQGGDVEEIALFDDMSFTDAVNKGNSLSELKALIYPYWWEEELVLFFADNGVGKSILATQMAEYIAKGKGDNGLEVQTPPQKVLYFDFELHLRQISKRYNGYIFSDNLHRITIKRGIEPEYISAIIVDAIEKKIAETGAKVCIVDNISWLSTQTSDTEAAKVLMGGLHRLVRDSHAAMMAIAHCPKIEPNQPLTKNMLGGAKALSDFADGVFALARNRQGLRYIKLLKTRMVAEPSQESELQYFSISEQPFLHMEYEGQETEHRLLYSKQKHDFFNKIFADDKQLELNTLVKRIIQETNCTEKAARNRVDRAVNSGVLNKENRTLSIP